MDPIFIEMCNKIRSLSYSPYSNFKVGAVIKSDKDHYFSGCNVENISYGLTVCAESNAIGQMIAGGDRLIKEIYISSANNIMLTPCGGCRQQIREFSNKDTLVHMANAQHEYKTLTINELLPLSFDPDMLGEL